MDGSLQVSALNGREMGEILRSLGRIEAQLASIKDTQDDQDKRLSWLESKANWAIGALAALTFCFSAGLEFMKGLFR